VNTKEIIRAFLGVEPARRLAQLGADTFEKVSEIRLRADKPMLLRISGQDFAILEGSLVKMAQVNDLKRIYSPSVDDIGETLERISQYSFYAFESELQMGYITLPGGHRVGIAGQAILEAGTVRAWRHINGLNIRVAHSIKGCADSVLPHILLKAKRPLMHTMIISPPGCGKTTLLRDIVRQISDGVSGFASMTVGLVDERSEVAGCYQGRAQNDVGIRTDVLDSCPKAEGMIMLLRAMAPDVIAVDELGGEKDARAVADVLNAGVKLLCTAHGNSVDDMRKNPALAQLVNCGIFERFIVLGAPGQISGIYDMDGNYVA